MSTTALKRHWAEAMSDAQRFLVMFDGLYERWEFAGSLRRKKPEVGDVEHVIIPKFGDVPDGDSIFAATKRMNLVWHKLDQLLAEGKLTKHIYGAAGNRWGEKYRGVDFRGFNHELFMADAENFGSVLAIRTGPAEFSQKLVTALHPRGLQNKDGYVIYKRDGARYPVATEEAFFKACGMPFIQPEARCEP